MVWEFKGYDQFDPNTYCGDCDENHCYQSSFASYDADGDLMEFVFSPPSGNMPASRWYKKAGTVDTMATMPYRLQESPCCFRATISNVENNTIDQSWCVACDEINNTYNDSNGRLNFWLCSLSGVDDRLYPSGLTDQKYFTAPCRIHRLNVSVYMDSGVPPNIVSEAKLYADNQYYYNRFYGSNYGTQLADRLVCHWKKNIAVYDGDYARYGNRSYPSGYKAGDFGTYDGREFSVQFTPDDLYDDPDNVFPMLDGLCDFSSAIINIEPRNNDNTIERGCLDKSTVTGSFEEIDNQPIYYSINMPYCSGSYFIVPCNSIYVPNVGMLSSYYYVGAKHYISNHCFVTINGVTGIDDNVDDSELTYQSCQKCVNMNSSFDLFADPTSDRYYKRWSFGPDARYDYNYNIPDMCCECPEIMTCINDIKVSFDYVDGGTYYDIRLNATIEHSTSGTIATFRKNLADVGPLLNNLRCLDCDGLSVDLDFVDQIGPSGFQRCDFSNATLNVKFDDYADLQVSCLRRSDECSYCYGKAGPRYIQINFPENGWTWGPLNWNDTLYSELNGTIQCLDPVSWGSWHYVNCSGVQLFENGYILDRCYEGSYNSACTWEYSEDGNDTTGSEYYGSFGCCPSCDPKRYVELQILDNGDHRFKIYVLVKIYIAPETGGIADPETGTCSCTFRWQGYVNKRYGVGIPINNGGISENSWEGPYLDCEADLDGLELSYIDTDNCPLKFWEWDGSSLTLSTV